MTEIEKLIQDIDKLRENLNSLIKERKDNLLHEDVQHASKMLNSLIVEYNKILEEKLNKD